LARLLTGGLLVRIQPEEPCFQGRSVPGVLPPGVDDRLQDGIGEIYSAIIILAPLIAPMGAAFGVDPIHLGVIFLATWSWDFSSRPSA
jgi:hypothetical protein